MRIALVSMAFLVSACAALAGDREDAERLRAEIIGLIGDAECNNLVNCRVIGLGVRPCGGPEEYLAYSTWARRDEIQTRALEYNFLREELLSKERISGTCVVLPEPKAACINRRCVVAPADR